ERHCGRTTGFTGSGRSSGRVWRRWSTISCSGRAIVSAGLIPARSMCRPLNVPRREHMEISLQLYTVRDLTAKDFADTMKKVAQIGYRNIELAGYGNLKTAADAKKALDDAGLKVSGAHAPIE